jgi:hypothetical protein
MTGSCLCGDVRYAIDGRLETILHCHCSMCRKWHGSAFRTRAGVRASTFRWLQGEHLLSRYESSPGTTRTFCRICGSKLVSLFADTPETLGLALGTLDTDPGTRPLCHVFVTSKAPWFEITDDLPQSATSPDAD